MKLAILLRCNESFLYLSQESTKSVLIYHQRLELQPLKCTEFVNFLITNTLMTPFEYKQPPSDEVNETHGALPLWCFQKHLIRNCLCTVASFRLQEHLSLILIILFWANGYFDTDSHLPLWLSLVALPVDAAEALRSFDVSHDLAAILESVNVVLRSAADVGVVVPSILRSGASVWLETKLKPKENSI